MEDLTKIVINSDVEGQHRIFKVTPAKIRSIRVLLTVSYKIFSFQIVFSFLSVSLFALVLKWYPRFYRHFLFQKVSLEQATHFFVKAQNGTTYTCMKRVINDRIIYFNYKLMKYKYDQQNNAFRPIELLIQETTEIKKILDESQNINRDKLLNLYGRCCLEIPIIPFYEYLFAELTAPFYVLQYFTIVLWVSEGFVLFAIVMLSVSFAITLLNYILLRKSRKQLQEIAHLDYKVNRLIDDSQFATIMTSQLLPGDLFKIQENQLLPCDAILVSGEAMLNEATLTGESIPIPKEPMDIEQRTSFRSDKFAINYLFEGTKPVKVSNAIAMVYRTGFSSLRGQYFRNVLFPDPAPLTFYIQACKFLFGLGVVVIIIYFAFLPFMISVGYIYYIIIVRFFDALTWIIPPALPIFFSLCKTLSLIRLKFNGIFGSNPEKIQMAGIIDTVCFDKTGTLTNLNLKVWGHWLGRIKHSDINEPKNTIEWKIMGCCHHLTQVNYEVLGDPLEIEMVQYSGYSIIFEGKYFLAQNEKERLNIINIFEFSSEQQMMSVIVYDEQLQEYYLYCKGAPEKLKQICLEDKQTDEMMIQVQQLSVQGFRILGLGYKVLQNDELTQPRNVLEQDIKLISLIILENKLKDDTAFIISRLNEAKLNLKIISGDNPLTTINCARQSHVFSSQSNVTLIDFVDNTIQCSEIMTEQIKNFSFAEEQQELQLNDISPTESSLYKLEYQVKNIKNDLAITGRLLTFLLSYQEIRELEDLSALSQGQAEELNQKRIKSLIPIIMKKAKVFARMKPEQKKQIVSLLQTFGHKVTMVGDGANDCSAISQAEIGISFSATDASYTAPFSSSNTSIACVPQILCEGRASTCMLVEIFEYYITISVIKFIVAQILGTVNQNYSSLQYIYINYLSSIPIMVFYAFSKPLDKLSNFIPIDDMFRLRNQIVIYSQIILTGIGLMIIAILVKYNKNYKWVDIPERPLNQYLTEGQLNSSLFIATLYYFISCSITYYISTPFKEQIWKNILLMVWCFIGILYATIILFYNASGGWIQVVSLEITMEIIILIVVIITVIIGLILQELIFKRYLPTVHEL